MITDGEACVLRPFQTKSGRGNFVIVRSMCAASSGFESCVNVYREFDILHGVMGGLELNTQTPEVISTII